MLELSECPARAAAPALVATEAGYGKLGRCGQITSNNCAAKSGEVTEILSVGAYLGVRKDEIHEFRFPCLRFTRSASPRFLGGVSSNGNSSINLTNRLHSSAENRFWKASDQAVELYNPPYTPLYAHRSAESGPPAKRDTRGLSSLRAQGTSHYWVECVLLSPLVSLRWQSWWSLAWFCVLSWVCIDQILDDHHDTRLNTRRFAQPHSAI